MEASSVVEDDERVILVCTDPDSLEPQTPDQEHLLLTATDILTWDLPNILTFNTLKVHAHRSRLIEQSSYFRGLLGRSFSESCLSSITVKWDIGVFIQILKHIYDCSLDVTSENFLPLYEGAFYFGVETLILKCESWFSEVSSPEGFQSARLPMEDMIQIWKFGLEHASDFIVNLCVGCLARNFMWAKHNMFFKRIPHELLLSSVKHPHLTVDSNMEDLECQSKDEDNCYEILKQIRLDLLALWFAAGKRNTSHFRQLAEESIASIFRLLTIPLMGSQDIFGYSDLQHLKIRLTEYSKKVDLSNCPQITPAILLLSLLPSSYIMDPAKKKIIEKFFINSGRPSKDRHVFPQRLLQTTTFEGVQEVDISKCWRLLIEHAVDYFCKSFPCLRILKAAYLLNIGTISFLQLLEKFPLVCEIDLTVDSTPVIPALFTILSSNPALIPPVPQKASIINNKAVEIMPFYKFGPPLSNVTRLTLEGRTDVCDSVLLYISRFCVSLCHLNIKGCISVTDVGISDLICRCRKLNSIVVCDTSFGINSVQALSSAISDGGNTSSMHSREKHFNSVASNLQELHMGGCKGVSDSSLLELMSQTQLLKSLCLRGTDLVDQALYNFLGSSLEMLDVSNTKISGAALAHVIHRNLSLKCLKAKDCRNLFPDNSCIKKRECCFFSLHEELHAGFRKTYSLEEIEFGWGFSTSSLSAMEPIMMSLKTIHIGLGGMLGEDALRKLPSTCPLLEKIILHFQVISDAILTNMVSSLVNLQELSLCYCFGDISMSSFKFSMQSLTKLRLERVTPWMTNADLLILSQNCKNLVELSLLGCPSLNSDSQEIISHGWPGLVSIHLEECGEVTSNGVSAFFYCKALEDLLLRHNGHGLQRNFIFKAASEMPLLRKLSLDVCDASEGDFDIPDVSHCSTIVSSNYLLFKFLSYHPNLGRYLKSLYVNAERYLVDSVVVCMFNYVFTCSKAPSPPLFLYLGFSMQTDTR
ncbi:BTB/POZ domain-containing protein FBL11 isoform X2 [Arachis hypogaea]|uniref:BTB/POZ domain-containing protein FBL11 isoform X2 n=1 Tax=Arachis hypogaea TaxID=3818 RepID=UPI003B20CBAC